MINYKHLSSNCKSEIKIHLENGKSQSQIAKMYGISQSSVSRLKAKIHEFNSIDRIIGSGRKRSLSEEDLGFLIKNIGKDSKIGSTKLSAKLLLDRGKRVSPRTLRRVLLKNGYKGRSACSKPLLSNKNIFDRLKFAKKHISRSENAWKDVIWSDETKINLFGSDGRRFVRRLDGTRYLKGNLTHTVKHGGGNVMLWGCFSSNGVGELTFIENTMDKYEYSRILDTHLERSAKKLNLKNFIFQHDNDPKHSSKHVKEYLQDKKIKVLDWPSQSPDLNPIEHLWAILKKKVAVKRAKNKSELKAFIVEEWNKIDKTTCEKLVKSMNNRCRSVISSNGGHTKY